MLGRRLAGPAVSDGRQALRSGYVQEATKTAQCLRLALQVTSTTASLR